MNESDNWDLGYCKKCIQMTNHKDGKCLKCASSDTNESTEKKDD